MEEIDFTEDVNFQIEEEALEIKKAIDSHLIYREGNKFVLDSSKIIEENIKLHEFFLKSPSHFIDLLKNEIRTRYSRQYSLKYINLNENEQISNLRIEHLGSIVKVSGLLSNATGVLALVKSRTFECPLCKTLHKLMSSGVPKRCSCGNNHFKNEFKVIKTEFQNMQEIVLEENQDEIGDRSPRRTRVRLLDELCDKDMNGIVRDGNKIEVVGIVEEIPLKKDTKTEDEIYEFRIFALQVRSLENEFDETITQEDIEEIEEISVDKPLDRLSNSLAPGIIGNDDIKKTIILSMVRAVPRIDSTGKREKHHIHGLLVGDASLGKSYLLQEASRRHYKSRYISGERLSEAGISSSVEKDEFLGTWALKAGHLPKTNNGLALIDELDKADKGVQKALHTPMESGIVTIAKAGISATLKADCTVICGANPKNGRFDDKKSLVEQIGMEETLLTRFDWIWVMRDDLNENRDREIAESIWNDESEFKEIIGVNLFRKYIKYCQNFKPKTTIEAREVINNFYVQIRKLSKRSDGLEGMPIVARHLKGLKRMAEAHAKIRLSNEVIKEDAQIAVDLFKKSLLKLGLDDETGVVDFARIGPGRTASSKSKMDLLYQIVKKLAEDNILVQEDAIVLEAASIGLDLSTVQKYLKELYANGLLFEPRNRLWSMM